MENLTTSQKRYRISKLRKELNALTENQYFVQGELCAITEACYQLGYNYDADFSDLLDENDNPLPENPLFEMYEDAKRYLASTQEAINNVKARINELNTM